MFDRYAVVSLSRMALTMLFPVVVAASGWGAELVRLTPENWEEFAPRGKEVDCIYGDYVLRSDLLTAVIADPLPTRNANLTVRNVGGMLIDLTSRTRSNDQLSAYYPLGVPCLFHDPKAVRLLVDGQPAAADADQLEGKSVAWQANTRTADGLQVALRYTLTDGQPFVAVRTRIRNGADQQVEFETGDQIRADRTFAFGVDPDTRLFWADDAWFGQAYGVLIQDTTIDQGGRRGANLQLLRNGSAKAALKPNERLVISRRIFPGDSLLAIRGVANRLTGEPGVPFQLAVTDPAGPVAHAKVGLQRGGDTYATGRTDENGRLAFEIPGGPYELTIEGLGRTPATLQGTALLATEAAVELDGCGYVEGKITDSDGQPIPCKIAFHGIEGADSPDFGPDSAAVAVGNLHYSHNGSFRQEIAPGKYDVVISYGPEYDAVFRKIEVRRGEPTEVTAQLRRVVDTTGWISSDFHSHSSPSGDNTSSQLGRVLNLLCEHIEFAPCTEHNRVSTYVPWLQKLGVEPLMATCSGMELTGSPLPINHQNAFPLIHRPRTQDGGGPQTDVNPVVQIERLAFWDGASDKLIQENHPNLVQILADRDLNGEPDNGFEKMFGFMDVIEVHPPEGIFQRPERDDTGALSRNPIFHWMQLLNLGYRIPGVVNTDAHYNLHGSGWIRNYLKSDTDDPAAINTLDMVRASEQGHVIMTTGPFMEVSLAPQSQADAEAAIPGEDMVVPSGEAFLNVRVQCPNWLDINRLQVFVNGRPVETLNFTRRETPAAFGNGVVKFERRIPLTLKQDAHVIVAAIGEGLELGRVMGTQYGKRPPVAVSNPIFVDVDGGGFSPNRDLLDVPIPLSLR